MCPRLAGQGDTSARRIPFSARPYSRSMSGVERGVIGCRLVRFGGRLVGGVVADGDAPEVLVAVTDRERDGGEFDRSAVERACPGPSCGGLLRLDPADVADREAPPLGVVPVAVHRRGGYQPARDPVRGCLLGFEVWGEVAVIDPFEAEVLLGVFCFNVCSTGSAVFFRSVG